MSELKITLKSARVNANLTQQEIADKLCVSKHTIINWEKGKTKISYPCLDMLCRFYGCNISDLK